MQLESEASNKNHPVGLWKLSEDQRVPPWEWRKHKHDVDPDVPPPPFPAPSPKPAPKPMDVQCGSKHTCQEMTSCAEAMAFLNKCGLTSLNANHDGVPCETLCLKGAPE